MDDETFAVQRQKMVDEQLVQRGIYDPRIIHAFLSIPRHLFVPPHLRLFAYEDHPLPIGEGQTISQPYIVALMLQEAKLSFENAVLEIGTGSGYNAALLSMLVRDVVTIERVESLAFNAMKALNEISISNVEVVVGDGFLGYSSKAPYDAIIVTAGADNIPEAFFSQLKDSGRCVIPVGESFGIQKLMRLTKKGDHFEEEHLEWVRFVPLISEH